MIGLHAAMVNFSRSLLINSNFDRIELHQCNFNQAALYGVTVDDSNLDYSIFRHANMTLSWVKKTSCQDASFDFADLHDSQWSSVKLQRTRFVGADLCGVKMHGVNLSDTDMRFSNCLGGTFLDVIVDNIQWDGAVMIGVNNGRAPLPDKTIKTAAELILAMQNIINKGPESAEQLVCYTAAARYISQSPDIYKASPFNISATEIEEIGKALKVLEERYPYFTAPLTSQCEKQHAFYGKNNPSYAKEGKPEYSSLTQWRVVNQGYRSSEEHPSNLDILPPEVMCTIERYTLSPESGSFAHQQMIERAASKDTLPKKGETTRPYFLASILAETKEEQDFVSLLQEKEAKGGADREIREAGRKVLACVL